MNVVETPNYELLNRLCYNFTNYLTTAMMKKALYHYCSPIIVLALIVAVATIVLTGCQSEPPAAESDKVNEIVKLFDDIPLYPSKTAQNTVKETEHEAASIARTYQSEAAFEEVRQFYLEQLPRLGWRFVAERELKDRGRIRGERILEFQKDKFVLSIQFAGRRRADLGWNYAIRIAYPVDNREKV